MTAILPATHELLTQFYGEPPSRSMRAFVGIADGVPLAVFGLYYDVGRMVLFSDIRPEARRFKKTIVQGAKAVIELAKEMRVPVHAVAGTADGSVRLLERMGFKRESGNFFVLDA